MQLGISGVSGIEVWRFSIRIFGSQEMLGNTIGVGRDIQYFVSLQVIRVQSKI
jgi:hypothetical protein